MQIWMQRGTGHILSTVKVYVLVLSDSTFFTITIVAEAILTIVDSFTIVCFPIMNLLILYWLACVARF